MIHSSSPCPSELGSLPYLEQLPVKAKVAARVLFLQIFVRKPVPVHFSKKIRDKSPWDSTAVFIFLSFLSSLLKQCILVEIFLQFSLPPPYTKLKLGKNSGYTRPTLIVCGVRGGVGPVCIGKRPRNAKVSRDFCP